MNLQNLHPVPGNIALAALNVTTDFHGNAFRIIFAP
jgi:hypothetical protein